MQGETARCTMHADALHVSNRHGLRLVYNLMQACQGSALRSVDTCVDRIHTMLLGKVSVANNQGQHFTLKLHKATQQHC